MEVRRAGHEDLERILGLAAAKREEYEKYSPIFWRPAVRAREAQAKYFRHLLSDPDWICLVHETDGDLDGFILAQVTPPPPVYDPGGKACIIDDFVVASPSLWRTVGQDLREEAERLAAQAGATVSVTVCGQRDEEKRRALLESGSRVASEWHVRPIGKSAV